MTHEFPPIPKSTTMCVAESSRKLYHSLAFSHLALSAALQIMSVDKGLSRGALQLFCSRIFPKAEHFDWPWEYFFQWHTVTTDGCNDSGTRRADDSLQKLGTRARRGQLLSTPSTRLPSCAPARLHPPARNKNEQGIEKGRMVKL